MRKQHLLYVIYALLSILFLYTAASKFLDFKHFISDMNNQPFPDSLTPVLVWMIPLTETLIVVCFFFEKTKRAGLYASFTLMCLFTIYTGLVLLGFFDRVPFGCGGVIRNLSWPQHLVFNLFFVVISAVGIWLQRKSTSIEHNTNLQATGNKIYQDFFREKERES